MAAERIRTLLQPLKERLSARSYPHVSIQRSAEQCIALYDQVSATIPLLREACLSFFQEWSPSTHPVEWIAYGLQKHADYVTCILTDHWDYASLPHHAAELWPMFYEPAEPSLVQASATTAHPSPFRASVSAAEPRLVQASATAAHPSLFRASVSAAEQGHRLRRIHRTAYDDKDVRRIHEGKECDDPWICSWCEEEARAWRRLVEERYRSLPMLFLNPRMRAQYLMALRDDPPVLHLPWPPPPSYTVHTDRWGRTLRTGDYALLCTDVIDRHGPARSDGQTAVQRWERRSGTVDAWIRDVSRPTVSDLDLVFYLWNTLDAIQLMCRLGRLECEEIVDALT